MLNLGISIESRSIVGYFVVGQFEFLCFSASVANTSPLPVYFIRGNDLKTTGSGFMLQDDIYVNPGP